MFFSFKGIWYYQNITDFHYSYIFYTPIQGFEKISLVTKIILKKKIPYLTDVDIEFSLRIIHIKIGFSVLVEPKLPLPHIMLDVTNLKFSDDTNNFGISDYIDNDNEEFYWKAVIEVQYFLLN